MAHAHPLLDIETIYESPASYLQRTTCVFRIFDASTQDSGNISYGVQVDGERYFIKTAGSPDDTDPDRTHVQRVDWLLNAVSLAHSCDHPALPRLHRIIHSPSGPMLVYAWAPGELIHTTRTKRCAPESPYQRFINLPVHKILYVLDSLYALHNQLSQRGWVAVDFYDGCLIYDFGTETLHVVDLDMYHKGPFKNPVGRMFGSSRFMAPEEFSLNARIDIRTTVYTMGRTAAVLLSDGTLARPPFRGNDRAYAVIKRACAPAPDDRYGSMAAFYDAWSAARLLG